MANEFWIAAMLFGLSTSAALAQDVAGETSFRKCRACHSIGVDAQNKIGPLLNGIDGRKCGSVSGYSYSEANRNRNDR
jgi:cytochrome c